VELQREKGSFRRGDCIVPFKKTKEEVKELYAQTVAKKIYAPSAMRDPSFLDRFRGIYMPYWLYDVKLGPDIRFTAQTTERDGNYEIKKSHALTCKTELSFDGVPYDASRNFDDSIAEEIRAAAILLLQLEIPLPAVMRAAKIAHEAGVKVVLNPAPYRPLPDEIFRYVDLFIPNETELAAFSGMTVENQETALAAAHAMVEKGVKEIIVTLGSKGSLITDGVSVRPVPSFKVQAVDTTAAGDTYCGALCVALSEGKSLEEAALFASKASSLSVTKAGAQASMPYRKEIVL
jgi:sugar/nucleoside kinase (ribokinase family)